MHLTKAAQDKDQAGQADVTAEMVAAGVAAYERARPSESSDFNEVCIVVEVYRSMDKARLASR